MSLSQTLVLGLIAGITIFIGLPVGRWRRPAVSLRAVLNAIAVGVLLFLLWDVLSAAWEPIDAGLAAVHDGSGGLGPVFGYGLLFAAGLAVGLLVLVGYEQYMTRAARSARPSGPAPAGGSSSAGSSSAGSSSAGSSSAGLPSAGSPRGGAPAPSAVVEPAAPPASADGMTLTRTRTVTVPDVPTGTWSAARRLSLLIAVGIGLHNFAEGLAIGQSAASGAIALATLLVIGFGLHNATEGFGIVAPLAAAGGDEPRPSWKFLLSMGVIGGGPTFVGTWVGHGFTNEAVSVAFLTLAAGSITYVIAQLLGVAAKTKRPDLLAYGLLIGVLAGFITDAIVTAGGV